MTNTTPEIRSIPINSITILNPRARNKRVFNEIVNSIAKLGLKKPITVSHRKDSDNYDLVCGQGRIEAFLALGQTEIPAVVIEVSQEDCFVMSLVENFARRHPSSIELVREIGALKERGYSHSEIAAKTDFSAEYISAICYLLEHGEERLLAAVERGIMPHTIAIEISRAKGADVQQALADAYEAGAIPGKQVLAIRRIIEKRNVTGKISQPAYPDRQRPPQKVTAVAIVRSYRKETERQKLLVKKASLAQQRMIFIVNAMNKLLSEDAFVTLVRDEVATSIPRPLSERLETVSL